MGIDQDQLLKTLDGITQRLTQAERFIEDLQLVPTASGAAVAHTILDGSVVHTDSALYVVVEGALAIGNNTPAWDGLPPPIAAGYALVSDGTTFAWDQTPSWSGEHSFVDGIAFTGASGTNELTIPDNTAIAFELLDAGGLEYMRIVSLNAQPIIDFNNAAADIDSYIRANGAPNAFFVRGSDGFVGIGTNAPTDLLTVTGGFVGIDSVLQHNGDPDTFTTFALDRWQVVCGGVTMIDAIEGAINDTIILGGDALIVPDDFVIAVGGIAQGRLIFDSTPAPNQIQVSTADLNFVTAAHGIIHTDGVAIGQYLRADGTRYVPNTIQVIDLPVHTHSAANDGGSLVVGTTDTDATAGSVFFAGAAGVIQEDNADFFYDNTNNALGIRSNNPHGNADALYVPWIAGDTQTTAYFGSIAPGMNRRAIFAASQSSIGVEGWTNTGWGVQAAAGTGVGIRATSLTGTVGVFDLIGAGTAIADFRDNGVTVWTFQDGGNLLCGATGTLDLNGVADALILDADGDTTISADVDDTIIFEIANANDFTMTANAFNVLVDSDIVMGEAGSIGIGPATERIEFYGAGNIAMMGADVGVGTITPGVVGFAERTLTIAATGGSQNPALELYGNFTSDGTIGSVFFLNDASAAADKRVGEISVRRDGDNDAGRMRFRVSDAAAVMQNILEIDSNGNVGIATLNPGQILDINQGSGNMIADGYDNHSLALWKENLTPVTGAGMIDKLKSFNLFEWMRTPFVSTHELVMLAIVHFRITDIIEDAREYYASLALDDPVRLWIDVRREELRAERADLPEWTRKHTGLVADDPATMAALGDIIGYDERGDPTGYSVTNYVGFLHGVILDLVGRIEALEVA